jgi:CubicO group peptidase (beta-lactamase class C family)
MKRLQGGIMIGLTRRQVLDGGIKAGGGILAGALIPAAASAKPGPGGFSSEGLRAVADAMQAAVADGDVPGVVTLLYRHGLIAQVTAAGFRDEATKAPMRSDTIFRLASMTKPVISVAVLMLIEDGKLSLSTPAEKFLPELADRKLLKNPGDPLDSAVSSPRGITVLDLLTHRSGIATTDTVPDTVPGPATDAIRQADALRDEGYDAWMKRVGALPLVYEPGTHFNYGNSFDVLGILIARASGLGLPEFLEMRIFRPLGMKDTGFMVPAGKMSRFATNYAIDPATKQRVVADRADGTSRWARMPAFPSGGGGLVSTAEDYLQFARMLLGKGRLGDARLLSHEAVALMTANELPPDQRKIPFAGFEFWAGQGFGLGVSVVDDVARQARSPFGYSSQGSFGWPGAFGTWWQVDPKEDMIQIFLIQQPAADPRSPLLRFKEASYRALDD